MGSRLATYAATWRSKGQNPQLWGRALLRPRLASKMLGRRSGVRRSGLRLQMVQRGRWGGVVKQSGRRFEPAGATLCIRSTLGAESLFEPAARAGRSSEACGAR